MTAAAISSSNSNIELNFSRLDQLSRFGWGNWGVVAAVSVVHVFAILALQKGMQKPPVETVAPLIVRMQIIQPPKPMPPPVPVPPPPPPPPLAPVPIPKPATPLPPPSAPAPAKQAVTKPEPTKAEPLKQAEPPAMVVEASKPTVAASASSPLPTENMITAANSATTTSASAAVGSGLARAGAAAGAGLSASPAPVATKPVRVLPTTYGEDRENPKPPYPRMSVTMGEQGTVLVQVFIGADGLPKKAELGKSSGFERLDEAALQYVMRLTYKPGTIDGVPTTMPMGKSVTYKLDQ
jgi:periplasmic protein TonB